MGRIKEGQILLEQHAQDYSYEGYGVIRVEKYPIFVENMLATEIADIKIVKSTSQFAFAQVIKFHKVSKHRILVDNINLLKSGAAPLMIVNYNKQLEFKQKIIESLFKRNLPSVVKINKIVKSPLMWHYRNKISLHVNYENVPAKLGIFVKNSHELVPQTSFDLGYEEIDKIAKKLINVIRDFSSQEENNFVKNIKLHEVTIKYSQSSKEGQIIFKCLENKRIPDEFVNAILKEMPNIVLTQNVTSKDKLRIYKTYKLTKNQKVEFRIKDLRFRVSANAFYQINEQQIAQIYEYISNNLELNGTECLADLYAGVGTIGMYLSNKVKKVVCVELNRQATIDGDINSRLNNLTNTSFYKSDVLKFIDRVGFKDSIDVAVIDPPRGGLHPNIIFSMANKKISKIVYLSCNPRTLVRDLKLFADRDYQIKLVQPFDMFPQTYHIETLVILERQFYDKEN
ncbi:23S rRNA (uracil1939-C5)-methyltransferase [Metamycoplasma subdolum]|uniref:23S rRNA (Uracil1939-C5)-methyltransferase n=1 Tax=Metamycoplasma subdolum TaxID=92407 RepID=A0A3M0A091_9BACT|nr:23S rRNA (uracil(1939)-C(5))-methyltransferase RlmD [Metamycoplasma subdolum]RMA78541.1 23S rRNA (uracil1939-C5)-methyltransferase [Metamycoplasma subdolum]WPB50473.1 23S rRNA (uracil(1939)-C(5))-methyltransferase RlmD [Metamycoplasma subdolum]